MRIPEGQRPRTLVGGAGPLVCSVALDRPAPLGNDDDVDDGADRNRSELTMRYGVEQELSGAIDAVYP
jgi:hypothetical protein